jgi:hypothetical protein
MYQQTKPFPYCYIDGFLCNDVAEEIKREILQIADTEWDRYNNPFEQKTILRNSNLLENNLLGSLPTLQSLFDELTNDAFIDKLSSIVGYKLSADTTRNFWGVDKFQNGDKLDMHVDAGFHPITNMKRHVTLGLYLSDNWKEEYGCHLELWNGTSCSSETPVLIQNVASIAPLFNRLFFFTCNDYSWHGAPCPVINDNTNSTRILVRVAYVSDYCGDGDFTNCRKKAFFIGTPVNPYDEEKQKIRNLRADASLCSNVYRCV